MRFPFFAEEVFINGGSGTVTGFVEIDNHEITRTAEITETDITMEDGSIVKLTDDEIRELEHRVDTVLEDAGMPAVSMARYQLSLS